MRVHPPRHPAPGPLPDTPPAPRERRARAATEALLGAALLLGVVLGIARSVERADADTWPTGREAPPPAPTEEPEPTPAWSPLPVDVTRDGLSRLRLLPGIGPARARAILLDRATHGPVERVEDLVRIRGLGPRTVAALRRAGARARDAP